MTMTMMYINTGIEYEIWHKAITQEVKRIAPGESLVISDGWELVGIYDKPHVADFSVEMWLEGEINYSAFGAE